MNNVCCVPDCSLTGKEKLLHFPNPVFPDFRDRFKGWLTFIGENVTEFDKRYEILYAKYKYKRMCTKHFNPRYYTDGKGEKVFIYSMPELHKPKRPVTPSEEEHIMVDITKIKKNYLRSTVANLIKQEKAYHRIYIAPSITEPFRQNARKMPRILRERIKKIKQQDIPEDPLKTDPRTNAPSPDSKLIDPLGLNVKTENPEEETVKVIKKVSELRVEKKKASEEVDETDCEENVEHFELETASPVSDETDCEENVEHTEIEYLESDSDMDVIEEKVPYEIEYLDINEFDNWETPEPQSSAVTNFKCTSEPAGKNSNNSVQEAIEIANPVLLVHDPEVLKPNNHVNSTTDVTINMEPSANQKTPGAQRSVVFDFKCTSEPVSKNKNNDTSQKTIEIARNHGQLKPSNYFKDPLRIKVDSNVSESTTRQQPHRIQQEPTSLPILEMDESGCISINSSRCNKPLNEPNIESGHLQKRQVHNINTIRQTCPTPPIIIKRLDKNTLQEAMKTCNLKPVDINSPLHKKLSSTMQLQKQIMKPPVKTYVPTMRLQKQDVNPPVTTNVPTMRLQKQEVKTPLSTNLKLPLNNQLLTANTSTSQAYVNVKKLAANVPNGNLSHKTPCPQQTSVATSTQPRSNALSNRERELRHQLNNAKRALYRYKVKDNKRKLQLKKAKLMGTKPVLLKLTENMPRIVKMITLIQFREMKKRAKGHRFTDDEKEMAYSLFRQSSSSYKFLRKIGFLLPRTATLRKHNLRTDVESAMKTDDALIKLKDKISGMKAEHRFCTLLFDEKLINPANRKKRVAFTCGEAEIEFEADHALIFMVKGILKFYQEPVCYTFSYGATSGSELAVRIKSVISDLQAIGFKVMATICDHADNNRKAIETLINETRCEFLLTGKRYNHNVFVVNNEEIIAMYDPPHLLKGIRNHLISKDLMFEMKGLRKVAKWKHLEMMLKENPEYKGERLVAKLTENHVYPTKQEVTKIKYASQLFSQTVSTYMGYLADKDILPPECRETADLLLFFDQLFDSLNGYLSNTHKNGKPLLLTVKLKSAHHQKWTESIEVLQTMKFIDKYGNAVQVVDLDCWVWTLRSIQLLLRKLLRTYRVPNVWMRNLNQDALERLYRVEVNPDANTRAWNNRAKKTTKTNDHFSGEVVTQKVIKAIERTNKQIDSTPINEW